MSLYRLKWDDYSFGRSLESYRVKVEKIKGNDEE